ncbi:MAG: TolC family protein [Desulfobacterales bacterium]|nr:TolC family protein [Desulfobacterales bacterium]
MKTFFPQPMLRALILLTGVLFAGSGAAGARTLTLDQAVTEALARNPRMIETAARRRAAEYGEKSARADFFPQVTTAYGYLRLEDAPYRNLLGNAMTMGSQRQHHWEVEMVQPLFAGFALTSNHRLAQLETETRELAQRQVALELCRQVKHGYFGLLLTQAELATAETAEAHLHAHVSDARGLFDQGLIARNDLLKTRVALAEAIQNRVRAAGRVKSARSALNVLLGQAYDADTEVAAAGLEKTLPLPPLAGLVAEALANRPEIASVRRAMTASAVEEQRVRSNDYPRVSLVGRYEQDGKEPGGRDNPYTNDHNASIGVQARWVLFEAGKTRAGVARVRNEGQAVQAALEGLQDQVSLEVQQAVLDLTVAGENIVTSERALDQAREHWRIANVRYRQQLTTATEVLDAQAYLTRAESAYHGSRFGYAMAMADLDRAVGRR